RRAAATAATSAAPAPRRRCATARASTPTATSATAAAAAWPARPWPTARRTAAGGRAASSAATATNSAATHAAASGSSGSNPDMGSTMMPGPMTAPVEWVTQTSGTNEDLYKVWGSSNKNVLIAGYSGSILSSDGGGTWKAQSKPGSRLVGLWGADANT